MSKNVSTFEVDMRYKELSKTKAKELKGLSTKKERDQQGLFIAEGEKCVRDMLGSFKLNKLISRPAWIDRHEEIAEKYESDILISDRRNLEILSNLSTPPEVVAIFEKPKETEQIPVLRKDKFYLLLDEIQDPGNLGTIIRTADWFGVYDIYASKNTADIYSPKVVQATMGSLSRVKVRYLNLEKLITDNRKIKLIGTLLDGIPLKKNEFPEGGMILMGNEGRGISEELKRLIDYPITIPPYNRESHPDSLNVAIATAIILSSLVSDI